MNPLLERGNTRSAPLDTVEPDAKVEGWTWHHGGRKWHYYKDRKAICGGMLLLVNPTEGYELGNDESSDNCAACKRKLKLRRMAEGEK